MKSTSYWFSQVNGLFPEGDYNGAFDAYGRMTNVPDTATPPYVPGDANGDNAVGAEDISLIAKSMVAWEGITLAEAAAADTNGDGVISAGDITNLAKYLAGWSDTSVGQGGPLE